MELPIFNHGPGTPSAVHSSLLGVERGVRAVVAGVPGMESRIVEVKWPRPVKLAVLSLLAYASLCGTNGDRYARLLPAIEQVESGSDPAAIGDGGKAVGILQIHTVLVDDANRIAGERRWTYADRLDADKSRAMFRTYSDHYSRGKSDEVVARRWNGGPRGDSKAATSGYWNKVRTQMEVSK